MISTEFPESIRDMIEEKKRLMEVIKNSLGIPKKYFDNGRNTSTKKI